jgi:hypothetical protein
VTMGTTTVEFTAADVQSDEFGDYFERQELNEEQEERLIASLYTLSQDQTIGVGDRIVVPIGYFLRTNEAGTLGSADDSGGYITGYALVGTETNPESMPKDASATYTGGFEIELRAKTETYGVGIDQIKINGDTEVTANFASGTVNGDLTVTRFSENDFGNSRNEVESDGNSVLQLDGNIISNGFDFDLTANEAAAAGLADIGAADAEVSGAGRFYGTGAEEIGALMQGDSANFSILGALWGERDDN